MPLLQQLGPLQQRVPGTDLAHAQSLRLASAFGIVTLLALPRMLMGATLPPCFDAFVRDGAKAADVGWSTPRAR